MDYLNLITLGLAFLSAFLDSSRNKLPAEIIRAVENVIAQLQAHKDDVITKTVLEAQRG